jgi:hypothetical protein
MIRRMPLLRRFALLALLLLALGPGLAQAAPPAAWSAHITFAPDLLAMWRIRVDAREDGKVVRDAHPEFPDHPRLSWYGPDSGRVDAALLPGALTLQRGNHRLHLDSLRLRLDAALNAVFVDDSQGRALFVAEMPHRHPGATLDWRYMNLRLSPRAAKLLGEQALVEVALGVFYLRGP